jgi:DNA replication protein DnaC
LQRSFCVRKTFESWREDASSIPVQTQRALMTLEWISRAENLADAAYETRSVAITSNIHPSGFDTIMPKALASPTVDRLLHHAHIVITEGESQRLAEAMGGKGVEPFS